MTQQSHNSRPVTSVGSAPTVERMGELASRGGAAAARGVVGDGPGSGPPGVCWRSAERCPRTSLVPFAHAVSSAVCRVARSWCGICSSFARRGASASPHRESPPEARAERASPESCWGVEGRAGPSPPRIVSSERGVEVAEEGGRWRERGGE
eukprot:scaffold322761_cov28-Tisochrysis_lutea.AAC.6